MNNIKKVISLFMMIAMLSACTGGDNKKEQAKSFEVIFSETSFNVQFDKTLKIPLDIRLEEGNVVATAIVVSPIKGELTILNNVIEYVPMGDFGDDTFTISISDNSKTVEQKFDLLISDNAPVLAFSDIISGSSTGLGDGKGEGSIVTVWGYKLNDSQGDSTVELCDENESCTEASYVYYWKNADGTLPGSPSNLYESHGMQEIAFSIPSLDEGEKTIKISNQFGFSTLPFTVRSGNIYHVSVDGDNKNDCSFESPCEYINGDINGGLQGGLANNRMVAGDIVYSHGLQEPTFGSDVEAGLFVRGIHGTELAPVAFIAYPDNNNFSRIVSANRGVNTYVSEGIIVSKYSISVGYADPTSPISAGSPHRSNYHLSGTKNGRSVGNLLIQKPNTCFTGWSGAIVSGGEGGQNYKVFGNHIKNLGCDNSSRYQHTIYMSIRNEDSVITKPWEIGFNYLDNNNVFYGIHNYDESYSGDCGKISGTLKIHNNVVVNQRGAGINVGTRDATNPKIECWGMDLEIVNNVLINVGLGVPQEDNVAHSGAIKVSGDLSGESLIISNNTIYGHGDIDSLSVSKSPMISIGYNWSDPAVVISNNVFVQSSDLPWIESSEVVTGDSNVFWSLETGDSNNPYPFDSNVLEDPRITITGSKISINADSPLLDNGSEAATPFGIYGERKRNTIGAVQK